MNTPSDSIETLVRLTDDELYALLSDAVLGRGSELGPTEPEGGSRFGRRWFNSRVEGFRITICESKAVREVHRRSEDDQLLAVATVADTLLASIGGPAALVAAVLVVRLGLDAFCKSIWLEP